MGRDVMAPRRSIATYAMVYAPPELGEKYPEALDGKLWLQSSVYLRPDSSGWLPEFFARTAILQPIDAQRQGETIATMLHASPDESAPKPGGSTDHRDEMLTVADSLYVPLGKRRADGLAQVNSSSSLNALDVRRC